MNEEEPLKVGHLTFEWVGTDMNDAQISCECGALELVKDYENHGRPKNFIWKPIDSKGDYWVECMTCREKKATGIWDK